MEKALTLKELLEDQLAPKRDLREMEDRVILKVGAMMAASVAIITASVKLL